MHPRHRFNTQKEPRPQLTESMDASPAAVERNTEPQAACLVMQRIVKKSASPMAQVMQRSCCQKLSMAIVSLISSIQCRLIAVMDGSPDSGDGQNGYERMIKYLPQFKIAVCIPCGYSVNASPGIKRHLMSKHACPMSMAKTIDQTFVEREIKSPSDPKVEWIIPEPASPAIPYLMVHRQAIGCPLCDTIVLQTKSMYNHCSEKHRGEYEKTARTAWRVGLSAQRFSEAGYGSRLFEIARTVRFMEAPTNSAGDLSSSAASLRQQLQSRMLQQTSMVRTSLEIITPSKLVAEINPWLERTKWIEHLEGHNLGTMSKLVDSPNKKETELKLICDAFKRAIHFTKEECGKLSHFDLKQINCFKWHQSYSRPFKYQIEKPSMNHYISVWQHILCYVFRMAERMEEDDRYALYKLTNTQVTFVVGFFC